MAADLEKRIHFSAGIGKNLLEAEAGLAESKAQRDKMDPENALKYHITIYDGESLPDKPVDNGNTAAYQKVFEFVRTRDKQGEVLQALEEIGKDPSTGLLTKLSFAIQKAEWGDDECIYVVIDANGMKESNTDIGWNATTDKLNASGAGVNYALAQFFSRTRSGYDKREKNEPVGYDQRVEDRRNSLTGADAIGVRMNGEGGDEILLAIRAPPTRENLAHVYRKVHRILDIVYDFQDQMTQKPTE